MALAQALLNTGKELGLNKGVQLQSPPLNTLRLVQVNIYLFLVYIFRVLIYQRILLYFTFNKKFDLELMQKLF